MQVTTFEISQLSEIKGVFAHAELLDPRSTVMLAMLRGRAFNLHGQSSFLQIIALMAANMVTIEPDAIILDFIELKYEWVTKWLAFSSSARIIQSRLVKRFL